jgi:hypothetical protein|tara:strand:- start:151 stop:861 length:711 start_codon:yes stop_codon:yes gene_type:complete
MKIGVLMWYDRDIEDYGDNCYKINKVYCDKYNYDLIKSSERVYDSTSLPFRKAHWERYPLILKHIKSYDYVIWIDADAFFYNVSPPITDLINKHKKEILFSEDSNRLNPPAVNSGVLILKNTARVINIIKKWAYSEELKDKYCGYKLIDGYLCPRMNWVEDQAVVRGFVKDNVDDINNISKLIPYLELQHYDVSERDVLVRLKKIPYIFHLAGKHKFRLKESKNYLNTLRKLGHDI